MLQSPWMLRQPHLPSSATLKQQIERSKLASQVGSKQIQTLAKDIDRSDEIFIANNGQHPKAIARYKHSNHSSKRLLFTSRQQARRKIYSAQPRTIFRDGIVFRSEQLHLCLVTCTMIFDIQQSSWCIIWWRVERAGSLLFTFSIVCLLTITRWSIKLVVIIVDKGVCQ